MQLENDILALVKTARSDLPLFLFGHSLGGLLSTKFIIDFKDINIAGCILTGPALGLKGVKNIWLFKKIISFYGSFFEDYMITGDIGVSALCKNKKMRLNLFNDGRLVDYFTGKLLCSIIHSLD